MVLYRTHMCQNTNYSYYTDGQLESVSKANGEADGESEQMYWDELALVRRGNTDYILDPAVTGGNPIMADDKVMFNDLLGNTLGNMSNGKFTDIQRTAFGETAGKVDDSLNFFTGKPNVEGLGYNFLYRNYRQDLGKWQTSDPLGYPDGWNNLAYVNNWVTNCFDWLGAATHSYDPNNIVYGTPEISSISYNSPEGGTGGYVYTLGLVVTITAKRSVTYTVVCPDNCEMNGTTKATYEYTTKSATVSNTEGEIVPGIPIPMGFNPIGIPSTLGRAAYEALIDQITSTLCEAAFSTNFSAATQTKINNAISSMLHSSGGWAATPINFGKCKE